MVENKKEKKEKSILHNEKELEAIRKLEEDGYKFLRWHTFNSTISKRLVDVECIETGFRLRKTFRLLFMGKTPKSIILGLKSCYPVFNINKYLEENNSPYKILSENIEKNSDRIEIEFTNRFGDVIVHEVRYSTFSNNGFRVPILEVSQPKVFNIEDDRLFYQESQREFNYYVDYDSYMEMITFDKFGKEFARIKIDKEDFDRVRKLNWSTRSDDMYTCSSSKADREYLHRFLTNCPKGMYVDHINGDKLDNKKENLRVCTCQENSSNRNILLRTNESGMNGVTWCKKRSMWRTRIRKNYKDIPLGYYKDLEEAKSVRRKAELEHFGDYAPNNLRHRGGVN